MTSEQARLNATSHGKSYLPAYMNWYKYRKTGITLDEYIRKQELKCPECVLKLQDNEFVSMSRADATRLQKLRSDNTSGLVGVYYNKARGWYYYQLMVEGVNHGENCFNAALDAAIAREEYIISNGIRARMNFEVH